MLGEKKTKRERDKLDQLSWEEDESQRGRFTKALFLANLCICLPEEVKGQSYVILSWFINKMDFRANGAEKEWKEGFKEWFSHDTDLFLSAVGNKIQNTYIYINLSVIFLTLFNDSRLTDSHVAHFCGLQGGVTHGLEDYNCALENLYPSHRKRKKTN